MKEPDLHTLSVSEEIVETISLVLNFQTGLGIESQDKVRKCSKFYLQNNFFFLIFSLMELFKVFGEPKTTRETFSTDNIQNYKIAPAPQQRLVYYSK